MIKISHLISHCYDRQAGYLSVITMAYQVRNLDHFLQFRLTRFGLNGFDCTCNDVVRHNRSAYESHYNWLVDSGNRYHDNPKENKFLTWLGTLAMITPIEHGYNELFYNEFMVITNLSLHPVVISVFHCSSFIMKLWL